MKRVLFILMLMAIGVSAQAGLKIGTVTVNLDQNTGPTRLGSSGVYSYDYQEKKLTLTGLGMPYTGYIESDVKDLTIEFSGNFIFTFDNSPSLRLNADTHITNQGAVYFFSKSHHSFIIKKGVKVDISGGVWVFNQSIELEGYDTSSTLTIKGGADVSITHTDTTVPGIDASNSNSTVEIDNSTLKIDVPDVCQSIKSRVRLKNSVIASPLKAVRCKTSTGQSLSFSESDAVWICDTKGDFLKGSLTIMPGTAYDLWLAGVQVNSENLDKLWQLDKSGSTNSIAYAPSTKTLSLNNAQLNSETSLFPPIHSEVNNLIINTVGSCYIGGDKNVDGIESTADFTINGGGTLQVFGNDVGGAIMIAKSTLTINDVTLKAIGGDYGLNGGSSSTVKVNNSNLTVSGTERAISVGNFDPDDNCFFMSPANAMNLGTTVVSISSTGGYTNATYVQTRPMVKYPLYINGFQVNEVNSNKIMQLLGMTVPGSITFYPPNELRINGLKIEPDKTLDDYFIRTTLDELILNLTGTNYIRASGKSLTTTKNVTVNGTGSIYIDTGDTGVQIGGTLKITGSASFKGGGTIFGIGAYQLIMTPGTELIAIAFDVNGRSMFCNSAPKLDGVALPADMYYNTSMRCVCYKANDQPVARKEVIINADNVNKVATGIEETNVFDTDASTRVYTTTGQLVWQGNGQPQLPSGIYIVNGKKTVIK